MRALIVTLVLTLALAACGHKYTVSADDAAPSDASTPIDASGDHRVCTFGTSHFDDGCQFGP